MMGPVPPNRRRGEIALLAGGLAASLLVAELAVRLLGSGGGGAVGYAPVSGRGPGRGPTNSRGYRDRERTLAARPGVRRVVCLGDSFTWGIGILQDDTWPARLERLLTARRGETWEAVSLAEPGLNAVQQASRLESEGLAYAPDVVVLAWVLNDSEDANAAETRRAAEWMEDARSEPHAPGRLLDRSALVRLVRTRVHATIENRRRLENYRSMYAPDYAGWQAAQAALRAMGGMCRARGVPLVVAVFPLFANPLDEGYPFTALHEAVASAAANAGASVVDLLPHYRGLRWELLVVDGANDEHPNEVAQRIATQAIARALDGVVPRDAPLRP
jgi:hypothetical protein